MSRSDKHHQRRFDQVFLAHPSNQARWLVVLMATLTVDRTTKGRRLRDLYRRWSLDGNAGVYFEYTARLLKTLRYLPLNPVATAGACGFRFELARLIDIHSKKLERQLNEPRNDICAGREGSQTSSWRSDSVMLLRNVGTEP